MRYGWKWTLVILAAVILAVLLAGWTWDDVTGL